MLQSLLSNKVKFLVVGAYAMGTYGYPRATGDFDLWVEASLENSRNIFNALFEFGAPIKDIAEETFCETGIIYQIGVAPRRIDIITQIDGVEFIKAYAEKQEIELEGIKIPVISKEDLIKNKKSTGREKDRLDVIYLKESPSIE